MYKFKHHEIITYTGAPIDDWETYNLLPHCIKDFLSEVNGFSLFNNSFHLRGCTNAPAWHSLKEVWHGETKLTEFYSSLTPDDIPVGQDSVGNQFILRKEKILLLEADTGIFKDFRVGFTEFIWQICELSHADLNPDDRPDLILNPGQLYSFYPLEEDSATLDFSLKAVDALTQISLQGRIFKFMKTGSRYN